MKVFILIYIIAWLILLATYHFRRKESTFQWSETDGADKVVLFLVILFAPLVVFIITYMLYVQAKSEKKARKEAEERERKELEEQKYRSEALVALKKAKTNPAEDASLAFKSFLASPSSAYATNFYTLMQKDENHHLIMKALQKLSLPEGATLHVEMCRQQGTGDESKLFVETPEGAYDYSIWNYIKVENSTEGIWNAYLLYNLWHVLPMFWHANYNRRYYLFLPEFLGLIDFHHHEDAQELIKALKERFISPDVVATDGKFYVSCCYFSNFGGLIQETIEISIDNGKASFHEIEQKTLVQYDCGIRF